MVRSQAGPKIADVADPVMILLVTRNQWLNNYISPMLIYTGNQQAYEKNFAFLAIQVSPKPPESAIPYILHDYIF